jgi:mannose-6-phosphate isomerase-like protein (cupin superfamily)
MPVGLTGFKLSSLGACQHLKEFTMEDNTIRVTSWPEDAKPDKTALMEIMSKEGLNPYSWSNGPGDVYGAHRHQYNKVIYVVSGSITFGLPEQDDSVDLQAGDRLDLPAGVMHDAVVGPTGVVCLEAHC